MRRILPLVVPPATLCVIVLSFFILQKYHARPAILGISQVSAFSFKKPTPLKAGPKLPTLPANSVTIITPMPSITPVSTKVPIRSEPTPTKVVTPTPTLVKKPTLTPTHTPIALSPNPIRSETTATPMPQTSSIQAYLMQKINEYRASNNLPAVEIDPQTCSFAKTRADEIRSAFNHDGFTSRINNKTLPYQSYHSVTENIAMTGNYKDVITMWINSAGHAENMRKDTPYVCVQQSGNYFAYEGWRP